MTKGFLAANASVSYLRSTATERQTFVSALPRDRGSSFVTSHFSAGENIVLRCHLSTCHLALV